MQQPDDLLRPSEIAELFGVRTPTIARWAREGRLTAVLTPGGHRRYRRSQIRQLLAAPTEPDAEAERLALDAVRLYDQGWSVRQVAERFGWGYGAMRRLLRSRTTLRGRGVSPPGAASA